MDIRPKVLIAKIGFHGHDRGSRVVASFLRDAGMEVIFHALLCDPVRRRLHRPRHGP